MVRPEIEFLDNEWQTSLNIFKLTNKIIRIFLWKSKCIFLSINYWIFLYYYFYFYFMSLSLVFWQVPNKERLLSISQSCSILKRLAERKSIRWANRYQGPKQHAQVPSNDGFFFVRYGTDASNTNERRGIYYSFILNLY